MAYTASALSFMLENLNKPVILTGSQLPIGTLRTDGKENLITAIEIAAAKNPDGTAIVPEVCIFFENHLMRGNRTTKLMPRTLMPSGLSIIRHWHVWAFTLNTNLILFANPTLTNR